jgi:uncharacterized protein (TIGR03437 family)
MSLRLWMLAACAAAAWGQSPALVATRIYVGEPCGRARPTFFVDGAPYNSPVSLLWPEGSKHVVSVASQEIAPGIRCGFSGWTGIHQDGREDAKLDGLTIAITAGRDLIALRAEGTLEYRLQIQLVSEGSGALFACTPGPLYGKIYVNGQCFAAHGELWITADSEVQIQAYPPAGFVFNGWQPDLGAVQNFESKFLMNRPIVLYALFAPAVRVTLHSEPAELELLADRTRVRTPITLDWAEGSRHTLAPVSPQMDQWGAWWVFDSWSNGQPAQQVYIPQKNNVPESLTARFRRGAQVSLLSDPPGLKLEVDGRDNWPSYDFLWGVGSVHTVSAPAEQLWRGRRYAFQGWSNGGPAAQQVTVPAEAAAGGLRLVARYELLGRLRIESTHAVVVEVNGSSCRTPCLIEPRQGSVLELRAPERVMVDEWRRLEFAGWADQAPRERLWTAGPAEEALYLNYQAFYRVLALVAPPEGAGVRFEPPSADGFYAAGSAVRLVAEPRAGFRFRRWDGDLSGEAPELALAVSEPRIVRAVLEAAPWAPPSGVRNAAGQGSVEGVAPGSLIAVYGANLAPEYVAGPDSPLAQSLGGVTVSVGGRLLPLRFVSPEQINAQLFSDLAPGDYTLLLRQPERPELSVPFKVVPCAPGLFTRRIGEREAVLALGEDGRLIGFERPARRGELVTVLGTGFGPYRRSLPDGFAVPEELAAAAELAGEVEIPVGEHLLRPQWAGAAAGQAGVAAIRFRIGPEFPPAGEFPLKLRIAGAETNTAPLPLEPKP